MPALALRFFFQAEDGIRDDLVTGVQTCALPILYNEEENVSMLQAELRAALKGVDHEIIFVDDGSADHTVEAIDVAPNVRVIRFQNNAGQSAAIYAGLKAARGATLVLIDGDLQNDPADIPRLLAEIESGRDLVRS